MITKFFDTFTSSTTLDIACKLSARVREARVFAYEAHRFQKYGKLPYRWHLDAVAHMVLDHYPAFSGSEDLGRALELAFLHDVIEDVTGGSVALANFLGKGANATEIYGQCEALSNVWPTDYRKKTPEEYYEGIHYSGPVCAMVKIADRLVNLGVSLIVQPSPRHVRAYYDDRHTFAKLKQTTEHSGAEAMWDFLDRLYDYASKSLTQ